jgi:hypothetical protein
MQVVGTTCQPARSRYLVEDDLVQVTNDNNDRRNLELAVWKMLRAGVPAQLISSSLRLTESDVIRLGLVGTSLTASIAKSEGSPTS